MIISDRSLVAVTMQCIKFLFIDKLYRYLIIYFNSKKTLSVSILISNSFK